MLKIENLTKQYDEKKAVDDLVPAHLSGRNIWIYRS